MLLKCKACGQKFDTKEYSLLCEDCQEELELIESEEDEYEHDSTPTQNI